MNFPERHVVAPLTEKLYQKADMEKIPLNGTFDFHRYAIFPVGCVMFVKRKKKLQCMIGKW